MSESPQRRNSDPIVAKLVDDVAELKREMTKNTEVTEQVRDILASFRTIGAVAKWLSTVGAAIGMAYAAVKGFSRHQ